MDSDALFPSVFPFDPFPLALSVAKTRKHFTITNCLRHCLNHRQKHTVRILSLSAHRPVVSSWGVGRRQRPRVRPSHCPCSRVTLAWRYSKFDGSYPQYLSPATLGTTLGTRVVVQQRSRQYGKILNSACISVSQRNSGWEESYLQHSILTLSSSTPPPLQGLHHTSNWSQHQ